MNEPILSQTPPILDTGSPPPKCAICLGVCSNKCFSDSCMHEFCFSCLMEWSKIKAECPLCKKPFKSILHNIKSNEDYEEYIVADTIPTPGPFLDLEANDFLYLPPIPSRHFQFRTTFTVDPGGEFAIQQMLLSHPLTTNNYNLPFPIPRFRSRHGGSARVRGVSSATSFRRSIYTLNYWVSAPPDLTGRYRDVSPEYYRDNPSARNRLVPWLNRELNALLRENTQQVMNLVDIIMEHLPRWNIRNRRFRNLLLPYLNDKTDHFLHEFFNFMRSPYDMIGYDRHISYAEQPTTYTFTISDYDDEDDDSDVAIVNVSEPITIDNNPFRQPTIEVIEINSSDSSHDSDVIIRDAPVEVVDLLHSDSDNAGDNINSGRTPTLPFGREETDGSDHTKPLLPLKIRLKRKRQSREKSVRKRKKVGKRYSSCSSCASSSSSESSDSNSSSSVSSRRRSKKRRKYKKSKSRSYKGYKKANKDKYKSHKYKKADSTSSSSTTTSSSSSTSTTSSSSSSSSASGINLVLPKKRKSATFDSDDNIPLSKIKNKELQNRSNATHTVTSSSSTNSEQSQPSCSLWQSNVPKSPLLLEDYFCNMPASNSTYSSFQYAPLPGFPVDSRASYVPYQPSTSHFTSPSVSGYQPIPSYTPPIDPNISYYKNDYRYPNIYTQDNNRPPICVNIGVGTSPVNDIEELSCIGSSSNSSGSARVQSVIVKKEQKLLSYAPFFSYQNDSSDSNN